jgi:hypothetical protein
VDNTGASCRCDTNAQHDNNHDVAASATTSSTNNTISSASTLFLAALAHPQAGQWIEGNFTGAGVLHAAGLPIFKRWGFQNDGDFAIYAGDAHI